MVVSSTAESVERLLSFLEADPENLSLIADTAQAALADGRYRLVRELVERYGLIAETPPPLINLAGLAAMRLGDVESAAADFERCRTLVPHEPGPRYNLAWARSEQRDWAAASDLLDAEVVDAVPGASVLKVQCLHHLGAVEEALAWGARALDRAPDDVVLLGALSAAALDAEDLALAADYAQRAGDAPEGLATAGLLQLGVGDARDARQIFDRALDRNPESARARLGRGLVQLTTADAAGAAADFDRAAALFGRHLGSWIGAGWAYYIAGDFDRARQRFETAAAIDGSFAEAQGALAVLDLTQGRTEEARRRAETAMRLDRGNFAGTLATSLMLDADGETQAAERLRQAALNKPIGPTGQTIAQMAAQLAAKS